VRIARPKERPVEFKRKRRPPRQATKLLFWSTVIGLSFVVILSVVFIPRALEHGNPCVSTVLELRFMRIMRQGMNETVIAVNDTAIALNRSAFTAVLSRDGVEVARLPTGLTNGTQALAFVDNSSDALVGRGDYFTLNASVPGNWRFEVRLVCDGRLVGLIEWPGILT